MYKAIAFLLFHLLTYFSYGQPVNFFADGSRWVYHTHESSEPGQYFNHLSDEQNIIHGDTIISGLRYFKLYSTFHHTLIVNTFPAPVMVHTYDSVGPTFLRYDTLHHSVYYLPAVDSTERLIYDFNLEVGDTTPMQSPLYPNIISSIDTVTLFGVSVRRFFVGEANPPWADPNNVIIEGMGGSNGLTYYQPEFLVVSGGIYFTRFTCFQYGDSIYSPYNGECPFIDFVSATNPVRDEFILTIGPNPTRDIFSLSISEELLNSTFTIVDFLGRVIQSFELTELNTTAQLHAPGIYFWRVEKGRRLIRTGKIICE